MDILHVKVSAWLSGMPDRGDDRYQGPPLPAPASDAEAPPLWFQWLLKTTYSEGRFPKRLILRLMKMANSRLKVKVKNLKTIKSAWRLFKQTVLEAQMVHIPLSQKQKN